LPTPKEYRQQAQACLRLAREAKEAYVRTALVELARELSRKAMPDYRRSALARRLRGR
jgi:hypothetical protein